MIKCKLYSAFDKKGKKYIFCDKTLKHKLYATAQCDYLYLS